MTLDSIGRIMLGIDAVEAVDSVRNLDLIMDQYLSFDNHVVARIEFGCVKLKFLWQFRNALIPSVKWNLVNSTILSHLDYCSNVYYNFLNTEFKKNIQLPQYNNAL